MKAIRVTCPNCNATLRVAEGAPTVTCEYCGTPSAIQRRTRILERVVMPGPTVPQNMPRAVQRHTRAWLGFAILMAILPFAITAIVVWTTVRTTSQAISNTRAIVATARPVSPANAPPSWQGTDGVLVADVNGDGTPELVGRGRRVNAGDIVMLLALDLESGKTVWTSQPIGTYTETYRGSLSLAGDVILFASYDGVVRGFDVKDGKLLWEKRLDERVAYFCAGDDAATVNAVGADDVIRPIARATGTLGTKRDAPKTKHPRLDVCPRLPSDGESAFELAKRAFSDEQRLGKKLELWVDAVVRGPGGRVLGGSRAKGTHVTTIVALDDANTERWRATASPDGLGAEGPPRKIVVGARHTCIVYYGKEYRTACFALYDGKRMWDQPTPSFFEDLVIVGGSLIVTGNELRVHDLDSGNVRWRF